MRPASRVWLTRPTSVLKLWRRQAACGIGGAPVAGVALSSVGCAYRSVRAVGTRGIRHAEHTPGTWERREALSAVFAWLSAAALWMLGSCCGDVRYGGGAAVTYHVHLGCCCGEAKEGARVRCAVCGVRCAVCGVRCGAFGGAFMSYCLESPSSFNGDREGAGTMA